MVIQFTCRRAANGGRLRPILTLSAVAASGQDGAGAADEARDSPADARSLAGARRSVRPERRLQWLLVHVWPDRQRLSPAAAREEPGRLQRAGEARTTPGPPRLRRRPGRGLVPGDAAQRGAMAGP